MAAIVLDNVSVDFPVYGSHRSFRKALVEKATGGFIRHETAHPDRVTVNALVDISFELSHGDRLGLVGHNGAGKSTLLKVVAGVYEPTRGHVYAEGRITPLFDAMPGLDPEDTGYENIVTAGMLLGMSREEIIAKIPEIEEFSELGEFLSLPVRTYSTGMQTRLGFAVASAIEPGILLMDEGIGAGDARFAERASRRLKEFIGRSQIMVLASHSDSLIRSTCNKAALMQAGRILAAGGVEEVLAQYHEIVHGDSPAPAGLAPPSEPEGQPK